MGVEKEKSDDTEEGLTIFEIDFGARGNKRRDQVRIDDVIQHRQITPVGRQEWLHATTLTLNRMHAIADREAFRIRNGSQIDAFGREDPVGPRLVRFARRWRQIFQLNELRRGWLVTHRGEQRASLAVRK